MLVFKKMKLLTMLRSFRPCSLIVFVGVVDIVLSTDSTSTTSTSISTTTPIETEESKFLQALRLNGLAENIVIVTMPSPSLNVNFTISWALGLKKVNFDKFVIICRAKEHYESLKASISVSNLALTPSAWEGNDSIQIIKKLLDLSFSLVYSDVSVVWLSKNVIEFLRYTEHYSDFAYMSQLNDGKNHMDLSFFLIKPTALSKEFLNKLISQMKGLHDAIFHGEQALSQTDFCTRASFSRLDKLLFAQGRDYFNSTDYKKFKIEPLVVRANVFSSPELNQQTLVKANLWNWP